MPRGGNPQKRHARQIAARQRTLLSGGTTLLVDDGENGMVAAMLAPLNMRLMTDREREQLVGENQIIRRADDSRWLLTSALKRDPLLYEALTTIVTVNRGELPGSPEEFGDYVMALDRRRDGR